MNSKFIFSKLIQFYETYFNFLQNSIPNLLPCKFKSFKKGKFTKLIAISIPQLSSKLFHSKFIIYKLFIYAETNLNFWLNKIPS